MRYFYFLNIQDYVTEEILFKTRIYLQVTYHNRHVTHQQHMFLQTQLVRSLILHAHHMDSAGDTEKRQSVPWNKDHRKMLYNKFLIYTRFHVRKQIVSVYVLYFTHLSHDYSEILLTSAVFWGLTTYMWLSKKKGCIFPPCLNICVCRSIYAYYHIIYVSKQAKCILNRLIDRSFNY